MRKSSFRPRSTSHVSSTISYRSGRDTLSSRKASFVFSDTPPNFVPNQASLIDGAELKGKVKISSAIKNKDRCLSVCYRPNDYRYYAVALANGLINVYSSKTDNILYTLNNADKDLPFSYVSTTCVRFRPAAKQEINQESLSTLLTNEKRNRKGSTGGLESGSFLPPINNPLDRASARRKSSHTALGVSLLAPQTDSSSSIITATFTTGSVKTFNFLTEQCLHEATENREVLTLDYSCFGNMFATGGDDGRILLYDAEKATVKASYDPPFDLNRKQLRIYSIAFHPNSENEFISGGWNRQIQFYDARVPNLLVATVPSPQICGEGLSFHPQGNEFCVAAWDKNQGVRIFDYAMKRPLEPSTQNTDYMKGVGGRQSEKTRISSSFLYSIQYFMGDYIATCGAYPSTVSVINRKTLRNTEASIHRLPNSVYAIDTFDTRIVFILGNEVCVSEIYKI